MILKQSFCLQSFVLGNLQPTRMVVASGAHQQLSISNGKAEFLPLHARVQGARTHAGCGCSWDAITGPNGLTYPFTRVISIHISVISSLKCTSDRTHWLGTVNYRCDWKEPPANFS